MIIQVFAVKDKKAQAFLRPFFVPNEEVAKRAIKDVMFDELSDFARYSQDYDLWHIGEFDDQTGKLHEEVPTHICLLEQLIFEIRPQ